MGAILQSLGRTVVTGIVLLVVIIIVAGLATGTWIRADYGWWPWERRGR